MIAVCKLCGTLVTSRLVSSDPLQDFDGLATAFTNHISSQHARTAQELTAVANLSMKVYAMLQAKSSEENFEGLRSVWQTTIALAIFKRPLQAAEAPSSGVSSSSSPAPPSGS